MSHPTGWYVRCPECRKPVYVPRARKTQRKFCSRKCAGLANGRRQRKYDLKALVAGIVGDQCVLWPGKWDKNGYGVCNVDGKVLRAPVAAYIEVHGPVRAGHQICHSCDNPPCYNPRHLFEGTAKQNAEDRVAKGRGCRGVHHHLTKLTVAAVIEIRAATSSGRVLATQYGVSKPTIQRIKRRETWKHV